MAVVARPRGAGILRKRWIVVGIFVAVIAVVGLIASGALGASAPAAPPTVPVTRSGITATVSGIGTVAAARSVDLSFSAGGVVAEVLVKPGDLVEVGQPLVRLDDRVLRAQVANAEAALIAAGARLTQAQEGNARPEDVAAAQAALAAAQASYDKLAAGPAAADIASAQAQLASAQANYDRVVAGPTAADVAGAEATVRSAEAQLAQAQQQLNDLQSRPKPEDIQAAERALEQAKNSLWSQQIARDATCGRAGPDSADCRSANAAVAAQETAVNSAADQLAQAMRGATPDELAAAQEGVNSAQAALASAQANLENVQAGPTEADRQAAQAQLAQAQQALANVQNAVTAEDLAGAQASVDQARANLEKLMTSATSTDITIQQASVTQAEQALEQAWVNLENATLKAPFAGVVTDVNAVIGSTAGAGAGPAVRLVDASDLHVDLRLSENDVVKVAVGQPVRLTSTSLAGWSADTTVSYIAPVAEVVNGVVTYLVEVTCPNVNPNPRIGQTVDVSITTAQKEDALLVPTTALLPHGAGYVVRALGADGELHDVEVQVGLTDGARTEIVSGLNEGDQIVAVPSTGAAQTVDPFMGPQ